MRIDLTKGLNRVEPALCVNFQRFRPGAAASQKTVCLTRQGVVFLSQRVAVPVMV